MITPTTAAESGQVVSMRSAPGPVFEPASASSAPRHEARNLAGAHPADTEVSLNQIGSLLRKGQSGLIRFEAPAVRRTCGRRGGGGNRQTNVIMSDPLHYDLTRR